MDISRRQSFGLAAGAATLLAAGSTAASAAAPKRKKGVIEFNTSMDLKDPEFNRDTRARLNGDLQPGKEYVGWLKGMVQGVRPNEAVRDLFTFEGFSVTRMYRRPDGSWRKLLRETVFYRDIQTGEILKTWHNPYTGEDVRVVPIANDPYNQTIETNFMGKPYLMNWTENPDGKSFTIFAGVNLFYPNLLQPEKWVRESSGDFNQVTENFTYVIQKDDLANPNLTALPHVGSWQRITPWLPWMLMGQAEGCISYFSTFGSAPSIDALPQDLIEATRAIDPKLLRAPTLEEDTLPNESSLEAYAKEQQPAPVPTGWTPPKAPAAPKFQGKAADLGNQWAPKQD